MYFFLAKLDTLAVLDKNNFKIGEWDFFIFFEKGEWDFIHTKKLGIFAVSLKWLRSLKKNGGVIRVTPLLFFVLYGIIMLATSSFHVSCFSLFFDKNVFHFWFYWFVTFHSNYPFYICSSNTSLIASIFVRIVSEKLFVFPLIMT
jgi:hypothetical protein